MKFVRFIRERYILGWIAACLVLWAAFLILLQQQSALPANLHLIAFGYAALIIVILYSIQNILIPKLTVFSASAQIVFKTVLYISGFMVGYLLVFIIQALLSFSFDKFITAAVDSFYQTLQGLFNISFISAKSGRIISPEVESAFTTLFIFMFLVALISLTGSYIDTRWRQMRGRQQLQEAQIDLFQAQIQPHFLFNTLNSIVSVVRNDPVKAESLLIRLSEFFRHSFRIARDNLIKLDDEFRFTENYLILQKERFGERLDWQFFIDDASRRQSVPAMLLQPLVENALKHAWKDTGQNPLKISIRCAMEKDNLTLTVTDNGCGFDVKTKRRFPPPGHALDNIQKRLRLHFNGMNLFHVDSQINRGTQIKIIIPRSRL